MGVGNYLELQFSSPSNDFQLPDRHFHIFVTSKSGGQRILLSSNKSIEIRERVGQV